MYVLGTYSIIPDSQEMFAAMIDGVKSNGTDEFLKEMDSQEAECQIAEGEEKLYLDKYRKRDEALGGGLVIGGLIEIGGLAGCAIYKIFNRSFSFMKGAAITTGVAITGGGIATLAGNKIQTCKEKGSDLGAARRERLRNKVIVIAEKLKSLENPERDEFQQLRAAHKGFTKISTHYEKANHWASDNIDWKIASKEGDGLYYNNHVKIRFDKDGVVETESEMYQTNGNYVYRTENHVKRDDN